VVVVGTAGKMVMTDGSLDQWENCLDVNLKSLMAITNLAVPHLEKKGGWTLLLLPLKDLLFLITITMKMVVIMTEGGAVINVASTAGRHASGHVVPCASPSSLPFWRWLRSCVLGT